MSNAHSNAGNSLARHVADPAVIGTRPIAADSGALGRLNEARRPGPVWVRNPVAPQTTGRTQTQQNRTADEARFWDRAATGGSGFRRFFYEEVNRYLGDLILSELGHLGGCRLLFVGCGTGAAQAKQLAARGAEVWCLDVSAESVKRLMRHPFGALRSAIHPVVADAEQMPFSPGTFDVVVGKAILHHLDIPKFMQAIDGVCVSGARLVFTEPLGINPIVNAFRRMTPSSRVPTEHPLTRSDLATVAQHCTRLRRQHSFLFSLLALPWSMFGLRRAARFLWQLGNAID
jgi:SAM-dependent methyltransferase